MKKYLKRFFVLTMLCMLVTSTALNVRAAELNLASDLMTIEEENGPDAGYVIETRITGLPFTMVAKNVTSFLSSQKNDKGFVPANYQGDIICVRGTLYHSQPGGYIIRAGVCYYNYLNLDYEVMTSRQHISYKILFGARGLDKFPASRQIEAHNHDDL